MLKRLGLIQLVRGAGFGIRELQILFRSFNPDDPDTIPWQALAAAKIAEMDALIERTRAAKMWLEQALRIECTGDEDCAGLSVDETADGIKVHLASEENRLSSL